MIATEAATSRTSYGFGALAHMDGINVLFYDGRVKWMKPRNITEYMFDPNM